MSVWSSFFGDSPKPTVDPAQQAQAREDALMEAVKQLYHAEQRLLAVERECPWGRFWNEPKPRSAEDAVEIEQFLLRHKYALRIKWDAAVTVKRAREACGLW